MILGFGYLLFNAVFGREQKLDNGNTGVSEIGQSGRMCTVSFFFKDDIYCNICCLCVDLIISFIYK